MILSVLTLVLSSYISNYLLDNKKKITRDAYNTKVNLNISD